MNTFYIDCNKANSSDKDNLDNSQYTTTLKNSLTLPKGSEISIQSSFINQQGITGQSIEINEDITETIKFLYYKSDTLDIQPTDATTFNNPAYNEYSYSEATQGDYTTTTRINVLNNTAGQYPNSDGRTYLSNRSLVGATEQPLILLDLIHGGTATNCELRVGSASIKIKKGVYGITQISNLITDQINGQKDLNGNEKNPIQESIRKGLFSDASLTEETETMKRLIIPDSTYSGNLPNVTHPILEEYIFVDVYRAETLRQERIALNDGTGILWNDGVGDGAFNGAFCSLFFHDKQPSGANTTDYIPTRNGVYVGTPYFSLDYNSESSSYELGGLHTPYSFQTHDRNFNPMELAGKQGVYYKVLSETGKQFTVSGVTDQTGQKEIHSSIQNPTSRIGGIIIHNFGYETALKYGTKKNILDGEIVKNKYKFKEFFNEEREAKEAWKKTIWSRLGFTYEQFNSENNFENVRYYNNAVSQRLPGVTTNTYLDDSIIQSISSRINPCAIPAGTITPEIKSGSLHTNNLLNTAPSTGTNDTAPALYAGSLYNACMAYPVEAAPKAITAQGLPQLSDSGYYLITSDILDGYNDIVKNGDPLSLLGVVPKSSLSNQDFIYSSQDIVNTITNEKIINKIKVRFLNPDLTSPDLQPNSSIILRIDVPIPQPINNQPLIKDKEEEKKK